MNKMQHLKTFFRLLLGGLMTLAGVGHLTFQRAEFQAQVPQWLATDPAWIDAVVLLSGIVEIALGLTFIILPRYKHAVGLALALFFILIFPGNIAQYVNGVDAFGLDTDQKRLIRLFFQPVLIGWALWASDFLKTRIFTSKCVQSNPPFFEFEARQLNGKVVGMDEFAGKTILVVNTASKCGLTPQYEGLEALYQKYKSQGLVILGFPCNQFGKQESGTASEIESFCQVNYGVSFPMFDKIDVNGKQAHPIFVYLKQQLPGLFSEAIKWNFTKFVIDKHGKPVKRFAPTTTPKAIEAYLQKIL